MIKIVHHGISEAEREALYNLLREPFGVVEMEDKVNESIMSSVYIELPIRYDHGFIRVLGVDRWEGLKEILKNMRWRRGKSEFMLTMNFKDKHVNTIFTIEGSDHKVFNKAVEGIEYVVDTVYFKDARSVYGSGSNSSIVFEFNREDMRWYPRR